jgi:hypothetical protein
MSRLLFLVTAAMVMTISSSAGQGKTHWCQVDDKTDEVYKCYYWKPACESNEPPPLPSQKEVKVPAGATYTCQAFDARG